MAVKLRTELNRILRGIFSVPQDLYLTDGRTVLDTIFKPFDIICQQLARWFPYFRPRLVKHSLFDADFSPPNADQRENFIPVRLELIVEELAKEVEDPQKIELLLEFVKLSAARFHFDYHEHNLKLHNAFAPFDLDSDLKFERVFSVQERDVARTDFLEGLRELLQACNYFELPRAALDRAMSLKRPGTLPVVAVYDDYSDYHVFIRGVTTAPPVRFPRWQCSGADLTIQSERISRICVIARMNPEHCDEAETPGSANVAVNDPIVIKLFKDVDLERLNMIAPRVKLRFPLFDGMKIGGTFFAGAGSAIAKIIFSVLSTVTFILMAIGFLLAAFKSVMGFANRRTAYLQKYARRLYYHTLATNLSVVDVLTTAAELQEIKEFVLGYIMTLRRERWSTEREIDDDAERWLLEKFNLHVDFESSDALRKLREKNILEEREHERPDGSNVEQFRVVSMEQALHQLDHEWDNFFNY
ncbi:MAG: DUF3754 domain-containing protein [Planctomycetia bacterium]|nr:DUF3754 domain-containing protein [Planctomycetia bacterium]